MPVARQKKKAAKFKNPVTAMTLSLTLISGTICATSVSAHEDHLHGGAHTHFVELGYEHYFYSTQLPQLYNDGRNHPHYLLPYEKAEANDFASIKKPPHGYGAYLGQQIESRYGRLAGAIHRSRAHPFAKHQVLKVIDASYERLKAARYRIDHVIELGRIPDR